MWHDIGFSLQHGNLYIWLMIGVAFLAFVTIFERLIMLQFVFNLDFRKFVNNIKRMISADDQDRAMNFCKRVSHTSLPLITLRALEAAETDPTTVRGVIEEETLDFLPRVEIRLGSLPAFAVLVLLVGILGTIDSLWSAFHAIDILDTAKKQASLAQGVAGSLSPTAIGLVVSMIILVSHQILKGMAVGLTERIHYGVAVLHNVLVPPEVAGFIPMAAEAPAADDAFSDGPSEYASDSQPAASQQEEVGSDDAFDDASVEDIKDEEEII